MVFFSFPVRSPMYLAAYLFYFELCTPFRAFLNRNASKKDKILVLFFFSSVLRNRYGALLSGFFLVPGEIAFAGS